MYRLLVVLFLNCFSLHVFVFGADYVLADCPSFDTRNPTRAANALLSKTDLLFVGRIEREDFVGDLSKIYDPKAEAAVDITYSVEEVFKGKAGHRIKLRTPFFCEACTISNERELREALDADLGSRVVVYVFDEVDKEGRRTRVVSGGCPESIDADPFGSGADLVSALRRATQKGR